MDFGQSFSPASQDQGGDPRLRKRTPVQQALQTVSLQLPTATGGGPGAGTSAINQDLLAGRSGGVARQAAGQPRAQALLNALTAKKTPGGTAASGWGGYGGQASGGWGGVKEGPGSPDAALPGIPKKKPVAGGGKVSGRPSIPSGIPALPALPQWAGSMPATGGLPTGGGGASFIRTNVPRFTTPIGGSLPGGTSNAPPAAPKLPTPAPRVPVPQAPRQQTPQPPRQYTPAPAPPPPIVVANPNVPGQGGVDPYQPAPAAPPPTYGPPAGAAPPPQYSSWQPQTTPSRYGGYNPTSF